MAGLVTPSTAGPRVLSSPSVPSLPAAGSALCRQLSLSECDCPQGPALLVTITLGGGCGGGWIQRERAERGRGVPRLFLPKQCLLPPPPQDFQRPEQERPDPTPFCKKSVHKGAYLQSHCSFTARLGQSWVCRGRSSSALPSHICMTRFLTCFTVSSAQLSPP